jgi:arylsulfatase
MLFMSRRPNILLLMADQQAASTLGCYGNGFVTTPNLDALARSGTRFDLNLSNCPVCMPARASLLTGRSPEAHGVFRNGFALDPARVPLFSDSLAEAGYQTIWCGKHHWQCQLDGPPPSGIPYFGFARHHLTDDNQIGPYFDWVATQGDDYLGMVTGTLFNLPARDHPYWIGRSYISPDDIAAARRRWIDPCIPSEDKSLNFWVSPLPDELTQSAWIADRAIEEMRSAGRDGRPFFLAASFVDPHDPYNPSRKFFDTVDPAVCPLPVMRPGEHDSSPPHYQTYVGGRTEHPWINRVVAQTNEEWRMLRACYFAKVNAVDFHAGRILAALKEAGLADNTLVVFTSDHGDMMGDHGMITKGDFHYDACIRTPLIVRALGGPAGRVEKRPTSLLDLAPTFLDYAGLSPVDGVVQEGRPLRPLVEGRETEWRTFGVAEIFATVDGTHQPDQWARTLRDEKWRYTWFPGDRYGQLFDLEKDPHELHNLWGSLDHQAVIGELRNRLLSSLLTRCAPLPPTRYFV